MSLRVGSYLGRVSDLDNDLSLLIGNLAYVDRPRFDLARNRRLSDKITIIEALWPDRWGPATEFSGALKKVANYRNRFAHWVPDIDWEAISERNGPLEEVGLVHAHPSGDYVKNMKFDPSLAWRMETSCKILGTITRTLAVSIHADPDLAFDSLEAYVRAWSESDRFDGWVREKEWNGDVRFVFAS